MCWSLTCSRFSHPVVMEPWELSRSLCPDPLLKFVSPSHITTKPSTSWDTAFSHLLQDVKLQRKDVKTQSVVLVGRGNPSAIDCLIGNLKTVEKRIKNAYNIVDWNPFPVDSWLSSESLSDTKYLSLLANSSRVNSYLDVVCILCSFINCFEVTMNIRTDKRNRRGVSSSNQYYRLCLYIFSLQLDILEKVRESSVPRSGRFGSDVRRRDKFEQRIWTQWPRQLPWLHDNWMGKPGAG